MFINKNDTAAIIIDYQESLFTKIDGHEDILKNSRLLIQGLQALEIPMIITRQYPKGIGDTVEGIKEITGDIPVFDKISFSCYGDAAIKAHIDSLNRRNIILCGIESHICVLQTVISLKAAGYNPVLITDCIGSRVRENKENAVMRAVAEGAVISNSEGILYEMLEQAGTPDFKKILKLVK